MFLKCFFFRNTKQTSKNVAETTFNHKEIINLAGNEKFFQKAKLIAILSTSTSVTLLKKLYIPKDPCSEDQFSNLRADRVIAFIGKYNDHPSIICIKDKISSNNPKFSFNQT